MNQIDDHVALVMDLQRRAGERGQGEHREHLADRIRLLPGAVGVEAPHDHDLAALPPVDHLGQLGTGVLGDAVRVEPVVADRDVDAPLAFVPHRLEDIERARDIGADGLLEVVHRLRGAQDARHVNHAVGLADQLSDQRLVPDIATDIGVLGGEGKLRPLVVQADDLVPGPGCSRIGVVEASEVLGHV
jgi:hypothetical protein